MSYHRKLEALRNFHTGPGKVRDTSGPVATLTLGPRWLILRMVLVTSPQGARDVLAGTSEAIDKGVMPHVQSRSLWGRNLFNMAREQWQPRRRTLQPFTKKHVATFAGHMADTACQLVTEWARAGQVDLDGRRAA
jgi:Cytochrome P450